VKEFVVYTLARLGLLVASYAVIVGVYMLLQGTDHVPLLWPILAAAVVSAIASYYLLKGPRERFAARVDARARAASQRFEERRSREDDDRGDGA
jgi:mannitol-specific phosphotransferase system IIBC component